MIRTGEGRNPSMNFREMRSRAADLETFEG
jgi:hypothetical protein